MSRVIKKKKKNNSFIAGRQKCIKYLSDFEKVLRVDKKFKSAVLSVTGTYIYICRFLIILLAVPNNNCNDVFVQSFVKEFKVNNSFRCLN